MGRLSALKGVSSALKGMRKQTSKMSASIVYKDAHIPDIVKRARNATINPSIQKLGQPTNMSGPMKDIFDEVMVPFPSQPKGDIVEIATRSLGSLKSRETEIQRMFLKYKHLDLRQ